MAERLLQGRLEKLWGRGPVIFPPRGEAGALPRVRDEVLFQFLNFLFFGHGEIRFKVLFALISFSYLCISRIPFVISIISWISKEPKIMTVIVSLVVRSSVLCLEFIQLIHVYGVVPWFAIHIHVRVFLFLYIVATDAPPSERFIRKGVEHLVDSVFALCQFVRHEGVDVECQDFDFASVLHFEELCHLLFLCSEEHGYH